MEYTWNIPENFAFCRYRARFVPEDVPSIHATVVYGLLLFSCLLHGNKENALAGKKLHVDR
jgi:hypothetical protein